MSAFSRIAIAACSLALVAPAMSAQSISLGLRGTGSFPTGSFAETGTAPTNSTVIAGAKNGFGYGLDAAISMGMLGVYAGFDHIKFDCETTTCSNSGDYTLQGVTVGVKLMPPMASAFRPFVKGGVTFNNLKGGYGGSSSNRLETDQQPGYEIGAGGDIGFMGIVSITPQVRYVGQNLKAKLPGVNTTAAQPTQGVNYFTFDLGLSLHTPFGM